MSKETWPFIPNWLAKAEEFSNLEFRLYCLIANMTMNSDWKLRYGRRRLCKILKCDHRAVKAALETLRLSGLIQSVGRTAKGTEKWVVVNANRTEPPAIIRPPKTKRKRGSTTTVSVVPQPQDRGSTTTESSIDNQSLKKPNLKGVGSQDFVSTREHTLDAQKAGEFLEAMKKGVIPFELGNSDLDAIRDRYGCLVADTYNELQYERERYYSRAAAD